MYFTGKNRLEQKVGWGQKFALAHLDIIAAKISP
jgi:hypothetical protein